MEPVRVEFAYDHNQLYLYDAETDFGPEANAYVDALDAATATGLTVGVSAGVVDLLMPRRETLVRRWRYEARARSRPFEMTQIMSSI